MPFECENPVCERHFAELERRVEALEKDDTVNALQESVNALSQQLANLNGRVTGYLLAGSLIGAVVAILAQVAILLLQHKP